MVLQVVIGQRQAVGVERVGLNDVGNSGDDRSVLERAGRRPERARQLLDHVPGDHALAPEPIGGPASRPSVDEDARAGRTSTRASSSTGWSM